MGSLKKMGKVGILSQPGRGGVLPNPNFLAKFPKTKFALQLSINVMKHTLHKWGGNISSIHNVIGPPRGAPNGKTGKVGPKLGQFSSEGGAGVLQSLLLVSIFQSMICLLSVHNGMMSHFFLMRFLG